MPQKYTTEDFIKQACKVHGNRYDYSKVNYTGSGNRVCIICPKHGEFWQTPHEHLRGGNCPKCSVKAKLDNDSFIEKARKVHGDKYDYSKVQYVNANTPVTIICPLHGEFLQMPSKHLNGHGCPVCGNKNNVTEVNFFKTLKKIFGNVEYQKTFPFLIDKRCIQKLDFYLPEYDIGIELNGRQHYIPVSKFGGEVGFQKIRKLDIRKYNRCVNNGIRIFYFTPPSMKNYITNYFEKVYTSFDDLITDIKNIKND